VYIALKVQYDANGRESSNLKGIVSPNKGIILIE